ncbi:hypothetical protein SAMN05444008_10937 [Cnuella takakiae]|uniref:VRR-NUC domain-containing protein n=1 Tax=Cnuella takakiae TaxID=1302690 RepID=A0A1M5CFF5_9BACT|nr:hypothetical protein [Cnuella takakiae]OLY91789.1 hypothetical protein BUE76_07670 [Cnuella takakiae]SHF53152.1 hypothetical protein SAMN05444008_10937 [Cnuella takakiae]
MYPNWKQLLRRMKLEHIKAKSPGFFDLSGGYALKTKPYNDTTSNGLTTAIEDFINFLPHGEASRTNTMGMPRVMNGQVKWTKGNTRKGIADIRGTYKGRSLSIEIKIGADRQREAQKKEQQRIISAGGFYWICKTFPDFLAQWEAAGFEVPQYQNVPSIVNNNKKQ